MIDFSTVQGITIPEGVVTKIEIGGVVMWELQSGNSITLEVEKIVSNTYAGSTTYSNEEFILLDIYPQSGGTVNVTYEGVTKTVVDTSGVAEPNAQTVFFGTFNGVSDSIATPSSGRLTIEGDCRGFGAGSYITMDKGNDVYYKGFKAIVDFGNVSYIPNNAFKESTKLTCDKLPDSLISIGDYAFYHCEKVAIAEIPEGVETIGSNSFFMDFDDNDRKTMTEMTILTLPSTLKSIGNTAFGHVDGNYECHMGFIIRATTPPTITADSFGKYGPSRWVDSEKYGEFSVIVPKGCGEAYKTAENWSSFATYITEEI